MAGVERGGKTETLSFREEIAKIFEPIIAPIVNFFANLKGKALVKTNK